MNGTWVRAATSMLALVLAASACGDSQPDAGTTVSSASSTAAAPQITGEALPLWTSSDDPAVGLLAPTVDGADYTGQRVLIDSSGGSSLLLFAAHWCPHCNVEVSQMIGWLADGTIPASLSVVLISTAEATSGANYPADSWLETVGWTGSVLRDTHAVEGAAGEVATAFGAPAWPFIVLVGEDGRVIARHVGELDAQGLGALLALL
jgi:hypothetical protein